MVFRFLFRCFRLFLQTLPKFSEGVLGPIHSDDSWLWKEVLGRRIGALHIPRRISFAWMKEVLTLSEGTFGRKEKRSEREDELPLRSVTVPDEGTYKKCAELFLLGRNVIRDT